MLAGRSLPHAVMMMIPEAYQDRDDLSDELKGFYAFHSCLMEPWDGPAAVAFTNGRVVGATLDRNGLRPGRWVETKDGYVVLGSETGMLGIAPGERQAPRAPAAGQDLPRRPRAGPDRRGRGGQARGLDAEALRRVVRRARRALQRPRAGAGDDARPSCRCARASSPSATRRRTCACCIAPMARAGEEPIGSMGNDAALAVLSDQRPPLFTYFKQLFAQVTNPPIDPIRESIVMSLGTGVGAEGNLLDETPEHAHQLVMDQPILRNARARDAAPRLHRRLPRAHDRHHLAGRRGPGGHAEAPGQRLRRGHRRASRPGINILILSDRAAGPDRAPIPSLLAVGAVHHHLVREGTRLRAGLVLESGEPREVHHFATLIGYGASAINPYLHARHRRRAGRARGASPASRTPTRPSGGSSRRSARACSRRSPRWGSRRSSPTAARRSSRPSASSGRSSTATSPAPRRASAASGSTCSPRRRSTATRAPGRARTRTCCRSAASTPGAATASTTCGTPRRSRCSSTPSAAATARRRRSTTSTPSWSTTTPRAGRRCAAC